MEMKSRIWKAGHHPLGVARFPAIIAVTTCLLIFAHSASTRGMCPAKCDCEETTLTVDCREAGLDVVPITLNPQLKQLRLASNQIKSIAASFSFYRKLEFLDLSYNNLSVLGKKNFAAQRSLEVLRLGGNKIAEIEAHTFQGLTSLRILELDENHLDRIAGHAFAGLQALEMLVLSHNSISALEEHSLGGLINLKALSLRANRLASIPYHALQHLGPNLSRLDLSANSIRNIEPYAFPELPGLEELKLDSCGISWIDGNALAGLSNLRSLSLQNNRLDDVPSEALELLGMLLHLDLSRNEISSLEPFAFTGLRALRSLVISLNQQLEAISTQALASNPNLTKLITEFCPKLRLLSEETFAGQKKTLKHLSLRGNGFTSLPRELLKWEALDRLDLEGNPLNCTCELLWLWEFIVDNKNFSVNKSEDLRCAFPPELSDQSFLGLSLPEMACRESQYHTQIITITVSLIVALTIAAACSCLLVSMVRRRARRQPKLAALFASPSKSDLDATQHHIYAEPIYAEPIFEKGATQAYLSSDRILRGQHPAEISAPRHPPAPYASIVRYQRHPIKMQSLSHL